MLAAPTPCTPEVPPIHPRSAPTPLRTRLTLHPGHPGAKHLRMQYGERLICVRYR